MLLYLSQKSNSADAQALSGAGSVPARFDQRLAYRLAFKDLLLAAKNLP